MQQLLVLQQRCSFVLRFVLGLTAAAYSPALRLAKKRRAIRCVTRSCDQKSPRRLESQMGVCLQTALRVSVDSCQGREQRSRTSSCGPGLLSTPPAPRGAPSQRPGDNSPRIARTTAKWHPKAARESRSSSPYASSWLRPPRDDERRREPRGFSEAEGAAYTYDGARRASHG